MKKLLLTGVAVLFLATGTVHAKDDMCVTGSQVPGPNEIRRQRPRGRSFL